MAPYETTARSFDKGHTYMMHIIANIHIHICTYEYTSMCIYNIYIYIYIHTYFLLLKGLGS